MTLKDNNAPHLTQYTTRDLMAKDTTMTPRKKSDGYRDVDGETLSEVLRDELMLRGHSQADAASALGTSQANVSRWIDRRTPKVPDFRTDEGVANMERLIRYLRLRSDSDYGRIAFNSQRDEYIRHRR